MDFNMLTLFGGGDQKGAEILGDPHPKGSKDPENRVLGPKYSNIIDIWALKPCYLGPWTFI